jgi:hypothetical protein
MEEIWISSGRYYSGRVCLGQVKKRAVCPSFFEMTNPFLANQQGHYGKFSSPEESKNETPYKL